MHTPWGEHTGVAGEGGEAGKRAQHTGLHTLGCEGGQRQGQQQVCGGVVGSCRCVQVMWQHMIGDVLTW